MFLGLADFRPLWVRITDRIVETAGICVVGVIPGRNARPRTARARALIRASPHVVFFMRAPNDYQSGDRNQSNQLFHEST